jgi:hypothetical protein
VDLLFNVRVGRLFQTNRTIYEITVNSAHKIRLFRLGGFWIVRLFRVASWDRMTVGRVDRQQQPLSNNPNWYLFFDT